MPYTISGDAYKEIAARRFSDCRRFDHFEHSTFALPHVRHQVLHSFNQDFGIIQFRADFEQDITVQQVKGDIPHVSLHFQLKGNSCADFKGLAPQPLQAGEFNLYASDNFQSDLHFRAQQGFEYLAITFRQSLLQDVLAQFAVPPRDVNRQLASGATFALSPTAMPTSPEIQLALRSLVHPPVSDNLLPVYHHSKVTEIITLAFSGFRPEPRPAWQREMQEVYHYILEHYLDVQSLADVARHFTLTEYQIKQQLRLQYDTTLYELVQERKMAHAMQLFLQTDMHVNEVAWLMGYANASNFILAFKRRFGVTPGQLSRNR
ncbi:helix-turn-helix transcriptional regulator [Chitinophaga sp. G-6-1-13]|uniref:Helix-turn-helix transcriptional regulator n=1 Tax=Chitinophaga fulva TaxID=2728842 RepID=A0A848GNH2_9BACT|nr:AraC family transcriptional regulator [Chitinophaga fulva]NML39151.1 helix-turn-helix transcriptional regulator [Chitinophaga fulva]